jgi:acyl dehydratase
MSDISTESATAESEIISIEQLRDRIGQKQGPSEWREVTQAMIDSFAELSGDHQWIHTDPERAAKESPFGTTIAHGNLTLSLIDGFREQFNIKIEGAKLGVNMGWNRVRFPAPVPAGSRVRASAELADVTDKGNGWWEVVQRFTIELEDGEKPACVADSVGRALIEQ